MQQPILEQRHLDPEVAGGLAKRPKKCRYPVLLSQVVSPSVHPTGTGYFLDIANRRIDAVLGETRGRRRKKGSLRCVVRRATLRLLQKPISAMLQIAYLLCFLQYKRPVEDETI
jgi:hypothetical protein